MIGLEYGVYFSYDGHETKKIIYVLFNGLERYISVCNLNKYL